MTETEFIAQNLMRAKRFAKRADVAFFIVAHPMKLRRDPKRGQYPIPDLYDISGSAHWRNKCDAGIVVWRDENDNHVDIYVKKMRFKAFGKLGTLRMKYDVANGRYTPDMLHGFDVPTLPPSSTGNAGHDTTWQNRL
jgi:twinkle protein